MMQTGEAGAQAPALQLPETDDYTFSDWLTSTRDLQLVAYGADYAKFSPEERMHSFQMNLFAAVAELVEMSQECGWKDWAEPHGWINRERFIEETVDLMHFAGNMLTHAGCTGEELTAAYKRKQLKNLQRQLDGYDGISSKCIVCRRDLGEVDADGIRDTEGGRACGEECEWIGQGGPA